MDAAYVFAIRFRVEPTAGLAVDPAEFETRLRRPADPPGEDGWRFFRDNLWRGELADETHFRGLATEALGVPVVAASFSALETDRAYLDALRDAIADDLDEFRAESATEAISKYLGSSVEVRG